MTTLKGHTEPTSVKCTFKEKTKKIAKTKTNEMVSKCVETCRYDPSATGLIHYAEMYGKLAFMI